MFRTTEKNSAAVDINCDSKGEVNNSTEETENNTRVLRNANQHLRVPPTSLTQINFFVTVLTTPTVTMCLPNTLSEFKFSNNFCLETAVRKNIPMYVSPPVHYPSIFAPVFLIIVVLVPLIF